MKHFLTFIPVIILLTTTLSCNYSEREFRETAIKDYRFTTDSINYNVTEAKKVWMSTPWRKEYTNENFANYILPPIAAKEPVEFYWRSDIPTKFEFEINDSISVSTAAQAINREIDIITKNEAWGNSQLSYSEIMSGKFAKCDDRSMLTTLAMRAYGIPAAFEYIPNWGNTNNGHSFCSVILPNDSLLVFQERQDDGIHVSYAHKVPKVYRKTFLPNKGSSLTKHINQGESIPPEFSDACIEDVTKFHNIGQSDLSLSIDIADNRLAYLCVFTPKGWKPVAYDEINNGQAMFRNVGNGGNYDSQKKGDNLGDGILYLPAIYEDKGIKPVGLPFVLSASGKKEIASDGSFGTVTLTRKYPRFERIVRFASSMTGGIFEASNAPDFSNAVCLYKIIDIPISRIQYKDTKLTGKTYRYARYRKPKGTFSISELAFFDTDGNEIKGEVFVPDYVERTDMNAIYDGKPLTYYEINGIFDFWAGIKFNVPTTIGRVCFCPRTDDNDICPGDEYELLFWNGKRWESLGEKIAAGYSISFDNVPCGALLWLKDRTKGKEERPFTYENGEQVWW